MGRANPSPKQNSQGAAERLAGTKNEPRTRTYNHNDNPCCCNTTMLFVRTQRCCGYFRAHSTFSRLASRSCVGITRRNTTAEDKDGVFRGNNRTRTPLPLHHKCTCTHQKQQRKAGKTTTKFATPTETAETVSQHL